MEIENIDELLEKWREEMQAARTTTERKTAEVSNSHVIGDEAWSLLCDLTNSSANHAIHKHLDDNRIEKYRDDPALWPIDASTCYCEEKGPIFKGFTTDSMYTNVNVFHSCYEEAYDNWLLDTYELDAEQAAYVASDEYKPLPAVTEKLDQYVKRNEITVVIDQSKTAVYGNCPEEDVKEVVGIFWRLLWYALMAKVSKTEYFDKKERETMLNMIDDIIYAEPNYEDMVYFGEPGRGAA